MSADDGAPQPTTPCCDCGGMLGTPWPEDERLPECVACQHGCAHKGRPFRWLIPEYLPTYASDDMAAAWGEGFDWCADRVEIVDGEVNIPHDQPGCEGLDHGEAFGSWLNDYDADTGRIDDEGHYTRPKVWLVFDTYGVTGEGPYFRSAHLSAEGAREAGATGCYMRGWGEAQAVHDCIAESCEGVWWCVDEVEMKP